MGMVGEQTRKDDHEVIVFLVLLGWFMASFVVAIGVGLVIRTSSPPPVPARVVAAPVRAARAARADSQQLRLVQSR